MILRLTLLGLLTAGLLRAETFKETLSETHPLDPRGGIRVEDANGSITIKTWDRPEVSIQVEKSASSEDYLKEIQVVIDAGPQELSVKTIYPHHPLSWLWGWSDHGAVQLILTVPESAELQNVSLANGAISIEGVRGAVKANTVNGGIHATGLREDVTLTTVNGSIRAEVAALDSTAHLSFTTINGSIAVLLPKNADATVSTSTLNGRTSCDLPIQFTESGFVSHSFRGTIGTGGGSIRAVTVNGSVHLQAL